MEMIKERMWSENMKKKTGFTLVELLGVLTVVAILCLIAFPTIIKQIKGKETEVDDATKKILYGATEMYIEFHQAEYPKIEGGNYCIALQKLVEEDLLEEPLKTASGETLDLTKKISVTVKANSELKMEYPSEHCA